MDAFDAFLQHLPAMTEGKVTSFHMLETEVSGFVYRCMPLLQSSGLPTDHKACSEAIRSGDFMLNEIRIGVGACTRPPRQEYRPYGPTRRTSGGFAK